MEIPKIHGQTSRPGASRLRNDHTTGKSLWQEQEKKCFPFS